MLIRIKTLATEIKTLAIEIACVILLFITIYRIIRAALGI
jgi:hypothetical protein